MKTKGAQQFLVRCFSLVSRLCKVWLVIQLGQASLETSAKIKIQKS